MTGNIARIIELKKIIAFKTSEIFAILFNGTLSLYFFLKLLLSLLDLTPPGEIQLIFMFLFPQ